MRRERRGCEQGGPRCILRERRGAHLRGCGVPGPGALRASEEARKRASAFSTEAPRAGGHFRPSSSPGPSPAAPPSSACSPPCASAGALFPPEQNNRLPPPHRKWVTSEVAAKQDFVFLERSLCAVQADLELAEWTMLASNSWSPSYLCLRILNSSSIYQLLGCTVLSSDSEHWYHSHGFLLLLLSSFCFGWLFCCCFLFLPPPPQGFSV